MPTIVRPELVPDPDCSREEMQRVQDEVKEAAVFLNASELPVTGFDSGVPSNDPIVLGVDQAFVDDRVVSAIVAWQNRSVIEKTAAISSTQFPYIPGFLSFREGGPILDAMETLSIEPDVVLFDGSGRIHFRQAGLAVHIGVILDIPSIGVAKSQLCGKAIKSLDNLPAGERVSIVADSTVNAPEGTVLGYALQTKQYDSSSRKINPVFVSPGHRIDPEFAVTIVERCCTTYKLPEPIRLADAHAGQVREKLKQNK